MIIWSTANGNNNKGDFNGGDPLQATYAALSDGSDPPDDSGPVNTGRSSATPPATGSQLRPAGRSQTTLTVAFHLQGLELAQPG